MIRTASRGAYALLVLLLAGCAGAGRPQLPATVSEGPPVYRPGDRFVYRNEKGERAVREVVAVRDGRVLWVTEEGFRFEKRDPFIPMVAFEGRRSRGWAESVRVEGELWPLAYRKRSRITIDYRRLDKRRGIERRYSENWRCRVNRPRSVEVPAGTFEVFKVVCKRFDPETEEVTRTHIWYWAPALGHWVKRVKKYADGRRKELELVAFARAL